MSSLQTAVVEYLDRSSFDVFENANRYPGPTGLLTHVAEKALEPLVYSELPEEIAKLHLDGEIYVHKLPYSLFIPYCAGHSLERLLRLGLETPTITARPARHYDTFVDHVANYLISMQHYFSGAQAFGAVELYAGPFIRRDGLKNNYGAVKQGVQRLVYNLNFPSRVGMQTPFTNFTVVLDAARKKLEMDRAVYAGEYAGVLGDYLEEAKLFIRALAEVHGEGDALGRPFTFPIVTFMTTSKIIYEDPEVSEALWRAVARKGFGYFLNTRVVDPDTSFAMCCRLTLNTRDAMEAAKVNKPLRLRILKRELEEAREARIRMVERGRFGGVWAIPDVTGSKAVITVNLPRIAYTSRGEDTAFYEALDNVLEVVRAGLLWFADRYRKLASKHPAFYMMPLKYLPEVFELYGTPYYLTVGVVGLPEAAAIFHRDPEAWHKVEKRHRARLAKWMRDVVRYIVEKARKWTAETGIPFNVEEVPAESAAAKLAAKDVKLYREIADYLPDPSNPIYSNSIVPYYADYELHHRIEIEEAVQPEFTGGVMMHIFLGEEPHPEGLMKFTRYLTENTRLVYWSYTPAISVCPKCGWRTTGVQRICPRCGSETEVWSRIVGYYRPLKNWNPARRREFWLRRHHRV